MLRGVLWAAGIGLATYLDARQLNLFGLPWPVAGFVAVGLVAPVSVVHRAPFFVWQFMAVGLLGCVVVFGVVLGPGYNDVAWPWPVFGMAALGLALFMVASRYDRVTVVVIGAVTVVAVYVPASVLAGTSVVSVAVLCFVTVVVLAWGDSVRVRRAAQRALAAETARRRAERQRAAVFEERARIARELHDLVAHHISMIAIQSEAAPHRISGLSPDAVLTFSQIRSASWDALTELRRVLGLLRRDGMAVEELPQPGIDDLHELVEGARRAGLTTSLSVRGVPFELDAGLAVSVYRVVQEALSNAARYAPKATVDVTVGFEPDLFTVRVLDNGTVTGSEWEDLGAGLGLLGMRERVRMLGGTLDAGPRSGGGFEVLATFPVQVRRQG